MMRRRSTSVRMVVVATLALLGCERNQPTVTPEPIGTTEPQPVDDPPQPEPVCGTPALRFADYAWIPDDSRLTTSIMLDDPELPAAVRTLASMADDARAQLPIRAAIDFRNLSFQLTGLDRVFAAFGVDPGELVELHSPAGDVVWLWPSDCPTLAARVLERYEVLVRMDFEHPGVRVGDGSIERFPFDLVLVRERFVALAPLGRGMATGAWLSASRDDEDGPGVALANIELAPIRSVLSGPSLLSGSETSAPTSNRRHRKIRATAIAWDES